MRSKLNKESVTHWPAAATNEFGDETFGAPVLIDARWEDRVENLRTPVGEEFTSRAVVYMDFEPALGDRLMKGDFTAVPDPNQAGAYEVRSKAGIPSMRTNQTEWRAIL